MKNINVTQAIILAISGVAVIVAVILFASSKGIGGGGNQLSSVLIWGSIPAETFTTILRSTGENQDQYSHISYEYIAEENFDEEFTSALAEGRGPDLVILNDKQIVNLEAKLATVPFDSYPLDTLNQTFIEGSEILITEEGYVGLPFLINPLLMYYNQDLLNSAGIARAPKTWTEVLSVAPSLSVTDTSFNVSKSAIALGYFQNIKNAKEIIWTLIMQAGGNIISRDEERIRSQITNYGNLAAPPAQVALNFFTQFSNPNITAYSWNPSLPNSEDFFVSGDLAMYLGFASELPTLRNRNPNLNIGVAEIPQSRNSETKSTYGKIYFLGIPRSVSDINSAWGTIQLLTNPFSQNLIESVTGLVSPRRDLISQTQNNSVYDVVFNRSALYARGVLEPNADRVDDIIDSVIRSIVSGQTSMPDAVSSLHNRLNTLFE